MAGPGGLPICEYCHAAYLPPRCQCQRCGSIYETAVRRCPSCGAELVSECPACGTLNPLSTRRCLVCGETWDAVDAILDRLTRSTPDQLRRVRQAGATIKAEEEVASKARLARMWAEEERRLEEQAQARAERARRERLDVALAVGVGAFVVVIAVIAAIIATGSASVPLP